MSVKSRYNDGDRVLPYASRLSRVSSVAMELLVGMRLAIALAVHICLSLQTVSAAHGADSFPVPLRHLWESDPDLGPVWDVVLLKPPFKLERARLQSGIDEYLLSEAQAILAAFNRIDASEHAAMREALLEPISAQQGDRLVRMAVLSAWCKFYDEAQAEAVWKHVQDDRSLSDFFEQVLVERQSSLAKSTWLARLEDPTADPRRLLTAIHGLAACDAREASPRLADILADDRWPNSIQLSAARALGTLTEEGQEPTARRWLASGHTLGEMIAANLLTRHQSDDAADVMSQLLSCDQPPAENAAYRWFANWRPQKARELAPDFLTHADNTMRTIVAEVLHRETDTSSLRLQASLLSDGNTRLRQLVREQLIEKARQSSELRDVVIELLQQQLAGERYQGIEQAILATVALEGNWACPQLIFLLDHPRPEVSIRAAWGLQQLAKDPQVLADILAHCQRWTARLKAADPQAPVTGDDVYRLSFLFGALGRNAYLPADEMLREYVPKQEQRMQPTTRIAAIWALGHLWENKSDSQLEAPLAARILDASPTDPEEDAVRYTAALTLGRIGNPASIAPLSRAPYAPPDAVGAAIAWALEQIQQKNPARSEQGNATRGQ